MAETNLSADLDHVTDIKEIGRYRIMGTPALIINGKVMPVGRVPPKGKIKEWLDEQMDAGRFGEVPDDEILEQIGRYLPHQI